MSYSPNLGRWMEQDPLGYVDGLNRYLDEGDAPASRLDSRGLTSADDDTARNTVVSVQIVESRQAMSTTGGQTADGSQVARVSYSVTDQYYAVFADGHREAVNPREGMQYRIELAELRSHQPIFEAGGDATTRPSTGVPRHGAATTQGATTQPASQPSPTTLDVLQQLRDKLIRDRETCEGALERANERAVREQTPGDRDNGLPAAQSNRRHATDTRDSSASATCDRLVGEIQGLIKAQLKIEEEIEKEKQRIKRQEEERRRTSPPTTAPSTTPTSRPVPVGPV